MEFSAVFPAPIIETINDQDVTFPPLLASEMSPFAEEIRNEWKQHAEAMAKEANFDVVQTYRAKMEVMTQQISLNDIIDRIGSLPAQRKP